MARKGELSPPHDLAGLNDSKVETLVDMFDKARKSRNSEGGECWDANRYKVFENWVQWREVNTHMSSA